MTNPNDIEDIVTKLRAERDEARLASVRFMEKMADILNDEANAEIEQLRKERDEARREVCNATAHPEMEAHERGWDCYNG